MVTDFVEVTLVFDDLIFSANTCFIWSRSYLDVSAAKKKLFADSAVGNPALIAHPEASACPPATPSSTPCPPASYSRVSPASRMTYQTREDQGQDSTK